MVQAISQVDVPAVNQPGLRAVVVASLISLVCIICALWSWMPSWKGFDRFPGLICILPFWMPYGFVLLRLYQGRIKSGLVLAGAMGCALFVPGVVLLHYVFEWERSWWIKTNLAFALLVQPVLVLASVGVLRSMQLAPRGWLKPLGSPVYGILLFASFWLAYSPVPRQIIDNEIEAKDGLREISWNNALQYEKEFGFYPDGSSLSMSEAECNSDHLLYLLRPKPENGYNLAYRAVVLETSVRGCRVDTSYIITARPVAYRKTGIRSFLVDQSKQDHKWPQVHSIRMHFTSEDRPATLSDPAEDVELFIHRPN
jgi:hypothetical protein